MESVKSQELATKSARPSRRPFDIYGSKRGRILVDIGCVPLVLVGTIVLLLMLNLVSFFQAPSWVTDKQTYLASGRLLLSIVTLAGLQSLATWALGLAAALFGLKAASGQGAFVARRLEVIRRRIAVVAWAIIAVRLVLVAVLVVGLLYLYTAVFGFRLTWDLTDEAASFMTRYPVTLGLVVVVCLAQWLVGPLLRLRYSTALGALAGAWSQDRDLRPWLALSLRLGMELAGMLGILWGLSVLRILAGVIFDPVGYPALPQYPDVFPQLPPRVAGLATTLVFVAAGLLLHTVLQIVLTQIAVAETKRRLGRPKHISFYAKTAESFRELARASVSKGEAD